MKFGFSFPIQTGNRGNRQYRRRDVTERKGRGVLLPSLLFFFICYLDCSLSPSLLVLPSSTLAFTVLPAFETFSKFSLDEIQVAREGSQCIPSKKQDSRRIE